MTTLNASRRRLLCAASLASVFPTVGRVSAGASVWPVRTVRVVVPFAAAGAVDLLARYVSARMQKQLGQVFVVDNRPGAGGNVGTELVVQAPADGYTLLVSGLPTHVFNPFLYSKLPFDPLRDLTHVAMLASAPNLLVVNPQLKVGSVEDLVKLARSRPGKISFSSAGNGTSGHLAGELLRGQTGVEIQHVPYRGQADALTAVMRGDVAFAFVAIPGTLQLVTDGRLRAIAVTSKERSNLVPDVATVAQAGFPDFEVLAWYSLAAPARTPSDVIGVLEKNIVQLMAEPETREWLRAQGLESNVRTGEAFTNYLHSETAKWGPIIRASGAVAN